VSRRFEFALAVAAVASVAPLFAAHFLPFSDMPEQIAVIAILRHWHDPLWHVQKSYVLALADSQYILYHAVGALLTFVTGSAEEANRILLALVGVSFPFALRALLRALGRDDRLSIFAVPVFWGAPLMMGFLPYVASVPLVTWGMAVAVQHARAPSWRRWLGLVLLAFALFYLHVSGYLLFALGAGALTLVFAPARRAPRLLSWLVPSGLVLAAWWLQGSLTAPSANVPRASYAPPATLAAQLPMWAHDVWRSHVDEICAVFFWAAFAVLAALRDPRPEEDPRLARAAWVPVACAALAYFALPYNVGMATMLNTRLATFLVLFMPLVLRPRDGRVTRAALAVVGASAVVGAIDSFVEVRRTAREELGDVDRLIDRVPAGARLLTLPFQAASVHTHWPPWNFIGSYHVARTGGIAALSFADLKHWPIHHHADDTPPAKPHPFWTFAPCLFRNTVDGAYYDYVLVRGAVDPFAGPSGPRWKAVDHEREWTLYERTGEAGVSGPDEGPCAK
jgi:hypothetical protein